MAMRFSDLLASADVGVIRRDGDADVTDVVADSRLCRAGCCFVAVPGTAVDGHRYIDRAVAAGAAAVVCSDAAAAPAGGEVAVAVVGDARVAVARLAQAVRGWPARKLQCIAVTGTNGKTTVAHLVRELLAAAGHSPAMLGTIAYETGRRTAPAQTTTPDPVLLAELTDEMAADGRTHLVMETSSHALDQRRTAGLAFDAAVFTNLSGDHLDYHGTMDEYARAKRRLFAELAADATAVINRDDPAGESMADATPAAVRWYGLSPAADVWAKIRRIDAGGTAFALRAGQREIECRTPLIGRHNVYNGLAALAVCDALGVPLEVAAEALGGVAAVPGRLQRVDTDEPFDVFVDYAHTDDALANVLGSLRPLTKGRLILVFGCGGDRDRTKRPRMAATAERLADVLVVTSDNPRSERPEAILDDILAGLSPEARSAATVRADRRAAIAAAVSGAAARDVVLIAGKGHETYQVLGDRRVHFDDAEVAAEALRAREGRP